MDDNREHPNPQGLEELESLGLGPGRLVEAQQLFIDRLTKATGFEVEGYLYPEKREPSKLSIVLRPVGYKIACSAAQFSFDLFPGNPDIVVSTGAYVEEARRGLGLGLLLLRTRLKIAALVGFQVYMATVAKNNTKEEAILRANGFTSTFSTATAMGWYKNL